MKRPAVNPDLLDVPLVNLPRLSRTLVAFLEDAGFETVGDCLEEWDTLAVAAQPYNRRTGRPEGLPVKFGRGRLEQLRNALVYYSRKGAPKGGGKRRDDPSEQEIRGRCAEIREGWDAYRWREAEGGRRVVEVTVVAVPVELRRELL